MSGSAGPATSPSEAPAADLLRALLARRFGESFDVPDNLPGVDALARIAAWNTHRSWSEQPLPDDLLRLLAACALSAPSKSYLLQADIVQVRDPAQRRAVEALVPSMPWMRQAPALLIFCGNGRRFRRIFERSAQPFANEHLDGLFNPAIDAALVMMNFIQAAAAVGLVGCPISVLRDQAAELSRLLAMPEHVFPLAGLCLGYPRHRQEVNPRLSLSATLITDRYPADDAGQGIDDSLRDFDERYLAMRSARRAPASAEPAAPPVPWTEEKRRQYAQPQRADWGGFLRDRGFRTD